MARPAPPPALKLSMQTKQNLLSGDLSLSGWVVQWAMLSAKSFMLGSEGEADVSWKPARPPHAHGTPPHG
eukprot:1161531-Pelagomonas_calceolata.AAC.7